MSKFVLSLKCKLCGCVQCRWRHYQNVTHEFIYGKCEMTLNVKYMNQRKNTTKTPTHKHQHTLANTSTNTNTCTNTDTHTHMQAFIF